MSVQDDPTVDPRQAPGLLGEALHHLARLIQGEVALAKREISQKISRAGVGIAMIAIAALLALTGLDVLAAAAVVALTGAGLPAWAATLIVAGVVLGIALVLVLIGASRLKPSNLKPDRSINQVRKDIRTIKENTNV